MPYSRIQIRQYSYAKRTESVGNLRTGGESLAAEEINNVAGEGDDNHGWHLGPFGLVQDRDAHNEEGDENEAVVRIERVVAHGCRGGAAVESAPDGCADSDAETDEQRINDGIDDSNRARNNSPRLQFERRTHCN